MLNAFKSIECAIAFDVRDWLEDWRSAWIYAIVFGLGYEDSWDEVAKKFGWDEEDRKIANIMHGQWEKAKETKEQPEIVKCKDCKYGCGRGRGMYCQFIECKTGALHKEDWFCAGGKRR